MRFQIRSATAGLAFYEGASAEDALAAFVADMVRGMAKVTGQEPDVEFSGANGHTTAHLDGETYRAVSA